MQMKQNMLRFLKNFEKEVKLRRMRTRQQMPQLCESSVVFVFFPFMCQSKMVVFVRERDRNSNA